MPEEIQMSFLGKVKISDENEKPLSEKAFYRNYSQHVDLRHRKNLTGREVLKTIKEEGFKSGGLNILPASDGRIHNVIDKKYGVRSGDIVYLVPNKNVDINKQKIKDGWKPNKHEVVFVEYDYQPMYDLYKKTF